MTYALLLLFVFAATWIVTIFNALVRDRQRVLTAWSDIDVQLKRRYDLIPKLVSAVEQYARYEQSTLSTLVELRSQIRQVDAVIERSAMEGEVGRGLRSLMALFISAFALPLFVAEVVAAGSCSPEFSNKIDTKGFP